MLKQRVGVAILLGYSLALLFVLGIGVLAVIQLGRINATVDNLTSNLAVDQVLADDIVNQALLARFYAHKYVRTQSQADMDSFYEEFDRLEDLLTQADLRITNPERVAMLRRIHEAVGAHQQAFLETADLIRTRQRIQSDILDIQEHVIQDKLAALRVHLLSVNDPSLFLAVGNAQDALHVMLLNTMEYLERDDERYAVQAKLGYQQALVSFLSLEANLQDPVQRRNAAEAKTAADQYYQALQSLQQDQVRLRSLLESMETDLGPEIGDVAAGIATSITEEYQVQKKVSQSLIAQARFVVGFTTVVATLTGIILGVVALRRVAEQTQATEALRESEERYRTLFEGLPTGLYRSTPEGQLLDANPALVQMLGYPDREALLQVKTINLYDDAEQRQRWRTQLENEGIVRSFEVQFHRKDGHVIWTRESTRAVLDEEGRVLYYEGSLEDITDRKWAEDALLKAQEQLVRREKLAVLGQLAGGVGHEIRGPLSVIWNALYLLKMDLPDADEMIGEYLDMIAAEVHKANKIVSDLLDFGRTIPSARQPALAQELVEAALVRAPAPEHVRVTAEIPDDLPILSVDPQQVCQVLVNLLTNAYQAMEGEGALSICAGAEGEQVSISITDTGGGISPENMDRLFEPLFTTKARGMGLGLAISKNLVEANSGQIRVESTVGVGTTFVLTLPTETTP